MSFTNPPKFKLGNLLLLNAGERWIHTKHVTYKEVYYPEHRYIFTGACSIFPDHTHTVSIVAQELFEFNQTDDLMVLRSLCPEDREWVNTGISPKGWAHVFPAEEDNEDLRNDVPLGLLSINDPDALPF